MTDLPLAKKALVFRAQFRLPENVLLEGLERIKKAVDGLSC